MKNFLFSLFSFSQVIVMALVFSPLHAQNDQKLNVYVKNFIVNDPSLEKLGEDLTSEFETELINLNLYNVLERRRYDRLMRAMETENEISDIQNLGAALLDSLKTYRADALFFGTLECYSTDGRCKITVSLQDIYKGNNIKKDYLYIVIGDINNPILRSQFLENLLAKLYSNEISNAKKEQFEFIDSKLRNYKARIDEITKKYQDLIGILLDDRNPVQYSEELNLKIESYNDLWRELNENRGKLLLDFGTRWGETIQIYFKELYALIMDDFHERFIRKLDGLRVEIVNYRSSEFSNKREKQIERKKIEDDTKEMTEEIQIEYNRKVLPKVNEFLNKLMENLNMQE